MSHLLAGVRAVVFDAVGTLIHPNPSAPVVYAEYAARFGAKVPADVIRTRFLDAFRREETVDEVAGWRTSEQRERDRWRRIVADTLPECGDFEGCFAALYDHFAQPDAWAVDADAAGVFAELTGRGLAIGLGSNYDSRLASVLDGHTELHALRLNVVVSAAVGWRKPAAAFFAEVARAMGVPADGILFVGDDRENDYDGATAAGLRAVMLDPRGRYPDVSPRIERLAELNG